MANAKLAGKIPDDTKAKHMMNTILQDWINAVNQSHMRKKIHGLIFKYSDKSTLSVKKPSHSFMKEKAKNTIQKLRKNLLNVTELEEREKKLNHIAQINIKGNAIFATSKLKPTAHSRDAVIHVPTLDPSITAKADVRERIHVHTNANTSTETTFELSNIVVINTQLQNDFGTDDVNFFNKFLNDQLVTDETVCSK